jgi:filamentous hemagglutinin family protein
MNKRRFCILYNEFKGQWVVVRESVRAKGAACYRGCIPMLLGCIAAAPALYAQVAAAPGAPGPHRPVVDTTANGRPLVQITAPNGAGLSNNHYTQFNVDGNGLILNNAKGSVLTQQGGFVPGNPFLAGGSARIILNQVLGTQLSQLSGYLEVAGATADVILANPNGIICNGGGFINTNRGVLTTGTPILGANGSLGGFLVRAGQIQIGDRGLNASNLDQLDLIARSLKVNGPVWSGGALNVITGANQVGYPGLGLQVLPDLSGKPKVGIDVAQLGGMYAKRIHLIGTEAGVGVNSKGTLAAQAGDFTCTTQGRIIHTGRTTASGDLSLTAQEGLFNSGTMYSQGKAEVASSGLVENRGLLGSRGDLTLRADRLGSTGTLAAGLQDNGQVLATGGLSLATQGELNATGSNTAGGDLRFTGASLGLRGASSNAGGNATLAATAGPLDHSGATLQAGGAFCATAPRAVVNDQGRISAQSVSVASASLSNREGAITQGGTEKTSLVVTGALDNTGGTIHSNGSDLIIRSQSLTNDQDGRIQQAGTGALDLRTGQLSNGQGLLASNGQIQIKADSLDNRAGSLTAQGPLTVEAQGDLGNVQGLIQAGAALDLTGRNINNDAGQILTLNGSALAVSASAELRNGAGTTHAGAPGGVISSQGAALLRAARIANSGTLVAAQSLNVNAEGAWDNHGGTVTAGQAVTVQAASLGNAQGQFSAPQVTLAVPELHNDGGKITAESLHLTARNLTNQGGQVTHLGAGPVTLTVSQALDNSGGRIEISQADLSLTPQVLANRAGTIASNGSLQVTADRIENPGGILSARRQATLTATQAGIDNGLAGDKGGTIVAEQLTLVAPSGALINAGSISAERGLAVKVQSLNNAGGRLESTGQGGLAVTAAQGIRNGQGFMGGQGKVAVTAASLENRQGTLHAGGDLEVQSGAGLDNAGGTLRADGNLKATAGGALINSQGGRVEAGGGPGSASTLVLAAAGIDNREGRIANAGAGVLTLTESSALQGLQNGHGFIGGNGEVQVTAASLDNEGGLLTTPAGLTVTARAAIGNREGTLEAGGALNLAGHDLANDSGQILALGEAKLSISAAGRLSNTPGNTAAGRAGGVIRGNGAVSVSAATLENAGTLAAMHGLTVTTDGTLDNTAGTLQAGRDLAVQSNSDLVNTGGTLLATGNLKATAAGDLISNRGRIESGLGEGAVSTLTLAAAGIENADGRIVNAGTGATTLAGTHLIDNSSPSGDPDLGVIAGRGEVTLNSAELHNHQQGRLIATGSLTLAVTHSLDNAGGTVHGHSTLTMNQAGATLNNQGGQFSAEGDVTLSLAKLDNSRGTLATQGALDLTAGSIDNASGDLSARGGAVLRATQGGISNGQAPDLASAEGGNIEAGQLTLVATEGALINQGNLQAARGVTVKVKELDNDGGRLLTRGREVVSVTATGVVDNHRQGFIGGQGDVVIKAGRLESRDSDVWAGGNLDVTTAGTLGNRSNGTLTAGGAGAGAHQLNLSADTIDNAGGRIVNAGTGDTTLTGSKEIVNRRGSGVDDLGIIGGAGAVTIDTPVLQNKEGSTLIAQGNLDLKTRDLLENENGTLHAQGQLTVDQDQAIMRNAGGSIGAAGEVSLTLAEVHNTQKGLISGQGLVTLVSGSLDNSGGTLQSQGDLQVTGREKLDNTDGSMRSNANLKAATHGSLTNTSKSQITAGGAGGGQHKLTVSAVSLDNAGGRIVNAGTGDTTLTGSQEIVNRRGSGVDDLGTIGGAGAVTIDTPVLQNKEGSTLIAQGNLDLKTRDLLENENGTLHAQGQLTVDQDQAILRNAGGSIGAAGEVSLTLAEVHNTQKGLISGQGLVTLASGSLDNSGGTLQSQGDLQVTGRDKLNNTDGSMRSNANLIATTYGSLTNTSKSQITAGGGGQHKLTVSAVSLDNAGGRIVNAGTGDTTLTGSKEIVNRRGSGVDDLGIIGGAGAVTIDTPVLKNKEGSTLTAQGNLDLKTRDLLDNENGTLHAQGQLTVDQDQAILRNAGGSIHAGGEVGLTLAEVHNTQKGLISGQGLVTLVSGSLDNSGGILQSQGDLQVTGREKLDNTDGSMRSNANLKAATRGSLTNTSKSQITAGGAGGGQHNLTVSAVSLDNAGGRIVNAGTGDTNLTGSKEIVNRRGAGVDDLGIIGGAGAVIIDTPILQNKEGSTLIAKGNLDLKTRDLLDNTNGTLHAQGKLTVDQDQAILRNAGGSIGVAGEVALTFAEVHNTQKGLISGQGLFTLVAGSLDNNGGTLQSQGDLQVTGRDKLDNTDGSMRSNANLKAATHGSLANTSKSQITAGGAGGGQHKLTVFAARLDNAGGRIVNLGTGDTTLTGNEGILNRRGSGVDDLGIIGGAGVVTIDTPVLQNKEGGRLIAQGNLDLKTRDLLDNTNGTLHAQGKLTVDQGKAILRNAGGGIGAAGEVSLTLAEVHNTQKGLISGQGLVKLVAGSLDNSGGNLQSQGDLQVTGRGKLDNTDGSMRSNANLSATTCGSLTNTSKSQITAGGGGGQHKLTVSAASLDNAGGRIVNAGTGDTTLTGSKVIVNRPGSGVDDKGIIGGAGAVTIDTPALQNKEGTTLIAQGNLGLKTRDLLDNTNGTLHAQGKLTVDQDQAILRNAGGSIGAAGEVALTLAELHNAQKGLISGQGLVKLVAGSLDNSEGTLQSAGDLEVTGRGKLDNTGGSIRSNANLIATTCGSLTNTSKSQITAGGAGGGQHQLTVFAARLDNAGGRIVNAGTGDTTLTGSKEILNRHGSGVDDLGIIGGAGALTIVTPVLQNKEGGRLIAQGNLDLKTRDLLDNENGTLQAQGKLTVAQNQAILRNAGGSIGAAGEVSLTLTEVHNTHAGAIVGQGELLVTADRLDNSHGALQAGGNLGVVTHGNLDNVGGSIRSRANLNATAAGAVNNTSKGIIRGEGQVTVIAQQLDNQNGALQSLAAMTVTSKGDWINTQGVAQSNGSLKATVGGTLANPGGKIEAGGGDATPSQLEVGAANIDNRDGRIVNAGTGLTRIKASEKITNGNAANMPGMGTLGGNGGLTIDTPWLLNNLGGQVLASQKLTLNTAQRLDNRGGKLFAQGDLELNQAAATVTNPGGVIGATGDTALTVHHLDNFNGRIGETQGGGDLTIVGDKVTNKGGTLASSRHLFLTCPPLAEPGLITGELGAHFTTHGNLLLRGKEWLISNHDKSFTTTGSLTNCGDQTAPGTLTLNAATITNSSTGRLNGANTVVITSGEFKNAGGIFGDIVALGAGTFTNQRVGGRSGAVVAEKELHLGATQVINEPVAVIYSKHDMSIGGHLDASHRAAGMADRILNNGAVIKTEFGDLHLSAKNIENKNSCFQTKMTEKREKLELVKPQGGSWQEFKGGEVWHNNGIYKKKTREWVSGPNYEWRRITRTTTQTEVDRSEPAQILAGRNLTFSGETFVNDKSIVAARGLDGAVNRIEVPPAPGERTIRDKGDVITGYVDGDTGGIDRRAGKGQISDKNRGVEFPPETTPLNLSIAAKRRIELPAATGRIGNHQKMQSHSVGVSGHGPIPGDAGSSIAGAGSGPAMTLKNASATLPGQALPNPAAYAVSGVSGQPGHGPANLGPGSQVGSAPMAGPPQPTGFVHPTAPNPGSRAVPPGSGRPGHSPAPAPAPAPASAPASGSAPAPANAPRPAPFAAGGSSGSQPTAVHPHSASSGRSPFVTAASGSLPGAVPGAGQPQGVAIAPAPAPGQTAPSPVPVAQGTLAGPTPMATPFQTVGSAASPLPNLTLPSNALYQIHTAPGHRYLVEADSMFKSRSAFESSDYMLKRLAMNPAHTHKRLGDGFYETSVVSDQVHELTGRVFLPGASNATEQFLALMDSGVACAQTFGLQPGIALTGPQMAALTQDIVWMVDQDFTLPDGQRTRALAPVVYLSRATAASPRPTGSLITAETVKLKLTGTLDNGGTLRADRQMLITATDIRNSGTLTTTDQGSTLDLRASQDLISPGSIIGGQVKLFAGQDLNLQTSALTTRSRFGSLTALAPVGSVQAESLLAVAGRDMNLAAAQVKTSGDALLKAGRDLVLGTVGTGSSLNLDSDARNHRYESSTQVNGTQVEAGGNLTLLAGNDLTATAATLIAGQDLRAKAGRKLTLDTADETSHLDEASYHTSSGFLNHSSHESRSVVDTRFAVGTTVSGNRVHLQAGEDLTVVGSTVSGTKGLLLEAEGDVQILAATSSHEQSSYSRHTESGLMSGGGLGFTIGSKEQTDKFDQQSRFQSQNRSLVRSEQGDLAIVTKGKARVSGSDLVAGQDFGLSAKSVTFDPGRDDTTMHQSQDTAQSGVTVALSTPASSATMQAVQTVKAMQSAARGSKDSRVKALAAATGGLAVANAASAMKAAGAMKGGGLSVSATYGKSQSHSETTMNASVSSGTEVQAGRHATIITTEGDLTVIGSNVRAGANLNLEIANKINASSGLDTQEQHSQSSYSSSSAGVAASVGQGGASYGFTASLAKGQGKVDGSDRSHRNSHLSAGQTVTINTGGDANFLGAVVSGEQIKGKIAGNLSLASQQDTSTFRSDQQNTSVSATVGGGAIVFGGFQKGKVSNDFASVQEQAGMHAGDGGFQLEVAGHTDLQGAVITSSNRAVADQLNSLQTATMAFSDLDNHAESSASAVGLSANLSKGPQRTGAPPPSWQPGAGAPSVLGASASAGSTTRSGISGAAITITDQGQQLARSGQSVEATLSGLNQAVRTGQDNGHGLTNNFDAQEFQTGLDVVQAFGQEVGTFVAIKAAKAEQLKAELAFEKEKPESKRDPAKVDQLSRELDAAKSWAPGGTSRQLVTAFTAAVSGKLSAGTTQVLQTALVRFVQQKGAAYIGDLVHGTKDQPGVLKEGSPEHAALHAIVAAGGAMASGQDVLSGSGGAAASSLLTNLFTDDPNLPDYEKASRRDFITTLVAGMAGVLEQDAGAATGAAHSALDNNFLAAGSWLKKLFGPGQKAPEGNTAQSQGGIGYFGPDGNIPLPMPMGMSQEDLTKANERLKSGDSPQWCVDLYKDLRANNPGWTEPMVARQVMQELESQLTGKAGWNKWQAKSADWMKSRNFSDLTAAWKEAFKDPEWVAGAAIATASPSLGPKATGVGGAVRTVDGLLRPGGEFLGTVVRGATAEIRTITASEFSALQKQLLRGAKPSGSYAAGNGTWYELPSGGRIGVRASEGSGVTLDIDIPGYPRGFKVHKND